MSIMLLFVIFHSLEVLYRRWFPLNYVSLDVSRATVGSWLSLLTLSSLSRNKQSSQLIACQVLFETISTRAPLKHARPIKRQEKTNRTVQLSSEQNEALPGPVRRTGALGAP